ncbi:YggT family protein [Microbacterium marinilacus]|uniref:YggT family protein n=1 Tax=Microbacterium marinilacus TaxID=415209 RepID=A0ABP7B457_9MICO|nr:YggT family protein [Microbacterium marinilacus]MBY0687811.1 YggT family protein [Microbacterium marinilacus]
MTVIGLIASILNIVVLLYIVVLFARLVLEYIPMFNREWRPRGAMLVVAEVVYTLTDPPIRFFRRVIPPLRLGAVALDFALPITLLACFVLRSILFALSSL